jgi:integrase
MENPAWTQRKAVTLLSTALRHAVRLRLIPFNPAADIPKAKPGEKDLEFFTAAQAQAFLAAASQKRLYALFALALGTGMRQGEILGLKWEDIDFSNGQLTVHRSLAQLKKQTQGERFVLKEPKSQRSRRTIRLPAFVLDALNAHRQAMLKERHGSPFVFTTKTGKHISKSNLTRQVFRPILARAGLSQVKFHSLRHSHASALLRDGASIKAVSQRLGHSTVELTLRVYCHLLSDADGALAGQAERLFSYHQSTTNGTESGGKTRTLAETGLSGESPQVLQTG